MRRFSFSALPVVVVMAFLFFFNMGGTFIKGVSHKELIAHSLLSKGNFARLQHVFSKARRGEDIVVGIIGGSITGGTGAGKVDDRWGNLVYRWWEDRFPRSRIKFMNAGIGGTGSDYGAHRVRRDLLNSNPDFVIVEFAVNDQNTGLAAETLEGLTRQILKSAKSPALLLLFMTYEDGHDAQQRHAMIGRYYGLPMISYGDAVKYALKEKLIQWKDIAIDQVHPNSKGHKYCAEFITSFLDEVLAALPDDRYLHVIDAIPGPIVSDTYEFTDIYQNRDITPLKKDGWSEFEGGWKAEEPGSVIEFAVTGTAVSIVYNRNNADKGMVEVAVDDLLPVKLNGWFFRSWTKMQFDTVASNLNPGGHILRIKLSGERDKDSNGHRFEIREIMVAGAASAKRR